jgi:hypothetical protein
MISRNAFLQDHLGNILHASNRNSIPGSSSPHHNHYGGSTYKTESTVIFQPRQTTTQLESELFIEHVEFRSTFTIPFTNQSLLHSHAKQSLVFVGI